MKKVIRFILLIMSAVSTFQAYSQVQTITGKVTASADGTTLPGVNVLVKGTNRGTLTDPDGRYSLEASTGETLVFSFIGYTTQEIPVSNSTTLNVTLAEDVKKSG